MAHTAQHSTAQHSTAQHSTAQHSTAQHSTAQHSTAQHSTAQLILTSKHCRQHSTLDQQAAFAQCSSKARDVQAHIQRLAGFGHELPCCTSLIAWWNLIAV